MKNITLLLVCIKHLLLNVIKKALPEKVVITLREKRKEKRFQKRFSYNHGKPFFKDVKTDGVSFSIFVDPFLNSGVDQEIVERGLWEPKLSLQLKNLLKPESVFLDIGANIGYHSLVASRLIKGSGHVYSFEPQKAIYNQLLESIQKNEMKNVTVHNVALSDHTGTRTLYMREENLGGSTLISMGHVKDFHIESSVEVPLVVLDSYTDTFTRVDVIKIDVEGYEFEVFKGAKKLLSAFHPVIIMEFSPFFYSQDYAAKPKEIVTFLTDMGYTFFSMDNEKVDMLKWLEVPQNATNQIDIICKHN